MTLPTFKVKFTRELWDACMANHPGVPTVGVTKICPLAVMAEQVMPAGWAMLGPGMSSVEFSIPGYGLHFYSYPEDWTDIPAAFDHQREFPGEREGLLTPGDYDG